MLVFDMGLDINDRGTVNHVRPPDSNNIFINIKDLQYGEPDRIGTVGRADAENPHVLSFVRRVLRQQVRIKFRTLMKMEQDDNLLPRLDILYPMGIDVIEHNLPFNVRYTPMPGNTCRLRMKNTYGLEFYRHVFSLPFLKFCYRLDMKCMGKHIHRLHFNHAIVLGEHLQIPGQGRRITGYIYNPGWSDFQYFFDHMLVNARPRRVDNQNH